VIYAASQRTSRFQSSMTVASSLLPAGSSTCIANRIITSLLQLWPLQCSGQQYLSCWPRPPGSTGCIIIVITHTVSQQYSFNILQWLNEKTWRKMEVASCPQSRRAVLTECWPSALRLRHSIISNGMPCFAPLRHAFVRCHCAYASCSCLHMRKPWTPKSQPVLQAELHTTRTLLAICP
jgi:hypothetical protein